ncbi:MAG TPA: glycosyltransferase, partial [Geobacteraceae bacterium]|nr:glycosyltransferase [Geobacteraceae bacterium]
VSKSSIPALLAAMDALYIGLQRQPLFRFGISPNKLMDYMMAGKPVINAIEAGNDPVAESGCGISVCSENSDAIAEAIQELMGMNEAEREVMGMRGKEYVLKHHDYRVLARKFVEIME